MIKRSQICPPLARCRDGAKCTCTLGNWLHDFQSYLCALGAEAVAENDSLASKLAAANIKVAALEADVSGITEARDDLTKEVESLHDTLLLAQADAATATAAGAEKARLEHDLEEALNQLDTLRSDLQIVVSSRCRRFLFCRTRAYTPAATRLSQLLTEPFFELSTLLEMQEKLKGEILELQEQLSAAEAKNASHFNQAAEQKADFRRQIAAVQSEAAAESATKQSYIDELLLKVAEADELRNQLLEASEQREELLERLEGLESELADAVELAKVAASERDTMAADAAACSTARQDASRYSRLALTETSIQSISQHQ